MISPTQILKAEHRVIERVLSCLEAASDAAQAGDVCGQSFDAILGFLAHFADRCHHGKEEAILFPALRERGIPHEGGPLGVMEAEHVEGRRLVASMNEALPRARRGDAEARDRLIAAARRFVFLLRTHIRKEDTCLFAMADSVLSPEDQARLVAAFDRVEHDDLGAGTHEHYLGVAESLCRRWAIEAPPAEAHAGCCHH